MGKGRSGGGRRSGGSRSRSSGSRSHSHSHRGIGHSHRGIGHSHHSHHHRGFGHKHHGHRSTYRSPRVVHINPYVNNPNVITLTWDRTIHGYNENDPNFDKMAAEGYDPSPVRKIVAELNALSKSMNFDDEVPQPNMILFIILFLLGIFPGIFYLFWIDCKVLQYQTSEANLRIASQPILAKYNPTTLRDLRYYTEAGACYPYVLAIHLVRENLANGDPNDRQTILNNLVNKLRTEQGGTNDQMPNMDWANIGIPNYEGVGIQMPAQYGVVNSQMPAQFGVNGQMMVMNQGQTNVHSFNV